MSQRGRFVTLKHIFIHTTVFVHQGKSPQIYLHLSFSVLLINFGVKTIDEKLNDSLMFEFQILRNFPKFLRYTCEDRASETRKSSFFVCQKTQTHRDCVLLLVVEKGPVDSYTTFFASAKLIPRNALLLVPHP